MNIVGFFDVTSENLLSCRSIIFVSICACVAVLGYLHRRLTFVPPLPDLDLDKWWGPGLRRETDQSVRPFEVHFSEGVIADLRSRLSRTVLTDPLEDVNFTYGTNTRYLEGVLRFWAKGYDFQEREKYINTYPQFKTVIQGLDIHYIHVKPMVSSNLKVLPIVALHGWPGSVKEYLEVIPLLTSHRRDKDFVFEVVVPSLPGFAYSQAPVKKKMGVSEMAVVIRNLMRRLGYCRFYVHGGDWGSVIGSLIAVFFPKEVLGYHCTMPLIRLDMAAVKLLLGSVYPPLVVERAYQDRLYPLKGYIKFAIEETGYMHLQATKPDTLGVALRDSPAGLAAYILEKFSVGTNPTWRTLPDGGLTQKYSLVDLIDNMMLYWTTGSITSSMRMYAESFGKDIKLLRHPITVPSAVVNFKHEIIYFPESMVRDRFLNLVQFTHHDFGGHFAAFEHSKELSEDIWSAVDKMRTNL